MKKEESKREILKLIEEGKLSPEALAPEVVVMLGKGRESVKLTLSPGTIEEIREACKPEQLPFVDGIEKDGEVVPFSYRKRVTKPIINGPIK